MTGKYKTGGAAPAGSRAERVRGLWGEHYPILQSRFDMERPGNRRKLELPLTLESIAQQAGLHLMHELCRKLGDGVIRRRSVLACRQTLPIDSWANVHQWLKDLLGAISKKHENTVFFIDCNPSFSSYTELSVIAADRLIVPCTADGSSARAISNIGQLIYGIGVPVAYASVSFSKRAKTNGLSLPAIHVIPLNRSTQYEQKASKAFSAMYDAIKHRAAALHKTDSSIFSAKMYSWTFRTPTVLA